MNNKEIFPFLRWTLVALIFVSLATGCDRTHGIPKNRRVFVFGLDGASWDFIDYHLSHGRLANFGKFKQNAAWCPLETIRPTISPVIWATIATGLPLTKHGVLGFKKGDEIITGKWRQGVPFWEVADRIGKKSVILNWWATYPATKLHNGIMVTDRFRLGLKFIDDPGMFYPPNLSHKLHQVFHRVTFRKAFRDFLRFKGIHVPGSNESPETSKRFYLTLTFFYQDLIVRDIALQMIKSQPSDLNAVILRFIDIFSHFGPSLEGDKKIFDLAQKELNEDVLSSQRSNPDVQAKIKRLNERFAELIYPALQFMDDTLGMMLASIKPEDYVLLISDHGFAWLGRGFDHSKEVPGIPPPAGIFALRGPDVLPGKVNPSLSVYDIAPLVLGILDAPLSRELESQFPSQFFLHPNFWKKRIKTIPEYRRWHVDINPEVEKVTKSDRALEDELRSLGYIQ